MDDYGKDFKGTVKIQSVSTLPAFVSAAADERRLIYCEDTEKFYIGSSTTWVEINISQVAGNNGNVQFNSSGSFGASDSLQWNNTNKHLGIGKSPSVPLDVSADTVQITTATTGAGAHSLPQLVLNCLDNATRDGAGGFIRFGSYNTNDSMINGIQINGGLETATAGAEQGCLDIAIYRGGAVKLFAFSSVIGGFVPGDANYWTLGGSGNAWSTVYAYAYVDYTPTYDGDALGEIAKIKRDKGKIDHETLPEFAKFRTLKPIREEREIIRLRQKKVMVRRERFVEEVIQIKGKRVLTATPKVEEVEEFLYEEMLLNDEKGKPIFDENGIPVTRRVPVMEEYKELKQVTVREEAFIGRDLGGMISVLTTAVQQLIKRIEDLEAK